MFLILGVAALLRVVVAARAWHDGMPFAVTVFSFIAAYLTLGAMFWPHMIPYSITVANAAAPDTPLQFLLYGRWAYYP